MRVAEFITGDKDDVVQPDVAGYITALLDAITRIRNSQLSTRSLR